MSQTAVRHLTSDPPLNSAGATEALLSLPAGWESPAEQQCVRPGEAMWQSSAARFED